MSSTREVVVDEHGDVVLPHEVLAEIGLKPGTPMLLSIDIAPEQESLVDELRADRRHEAVREDDE
jgi:bifunctional DNA-binding transcriptional regulator/antitoxin component of YhaV-PrlF toxin-antitoxin module